MAWRWTRQGLGRGAASVMIGATLVGAVLAATVLSEATIFAGTMRAQASEEIVFVVHGLRTDAGLVRGGIYSDPAHWTQPGYQVAVCTARPSRGVARCAMRPPGPGRYAFGFYHDADEDRELDRDVVGIPQEGYGFSNDARPGLGAPSFESAAFTVRPGARYEQRVQARYGWSP